MIKLEDLKVNDIIYSICEDGNYVGQYESSKVIHELCMIDVSPKPIEGVIVKCEHEIITRNMERYLYITEKEVEDNVEVLINNKAEQLLQSEEFVDKLFECATTSERLDRYGDMYTVYMMGMKDYDE